MKRLNVVVAMLLSLASAQAIAQHVVREQWVHLRLDVDAAGRVTAVGTPQGFPATLVAPMTAVAKRWRFRAPVRHGHPVSARTWANVKMQFVQQSGGRYGLHLIYGSNGPFMFRRVAPRFPADAIRVGKEAKLEMQAVVLPDGSFGDIRAVDVEVSNKSHTATTSQGRFADLFVKAATRSMAHSRARPEWVDGSPVPTHIKIKFIFQIYYNPDRLAKPAAAPPAAQPDIGVPDGEAVALDSPLTRVPVASAP
jgi:hypothetical protein